MRLHETRLRIEVTPAFRSVIVFLIGVDGPELQLFR
jgi:hypothetical protein